MSNSNDFVITKRGILTKYKGPGGNVVIPEGVTKIGNMAFKGCTGLQSVAIPEGVRVINWRAFSGCTSLTSVVIPESVTKIDIGRHRPGDLRGHPPPRPPAAGGCPSASRCRSRSGLLSSVRPNPLS